MSQEASIKTDSLTVNGKLSSDGGNISSDGVNGNFTAGNYSGSQQTGTVTTLSTGNTITPGNLDSVRVTAAAAITGVILAAGTKAGQEITVIHEGAAANTITFAAAGTSNVSDGVSDVITGPTSRSFKWDATTLLWYPQK